MEHKHPIQVEYAGIPESCTRCSGAKKFLEFLLSKEAQEILKNKNFMVPVNGLAMTPKDFELIQGIEYLSPIENWNLLRRKKEWMKLWKDIFY